MSVLPGMVRRRQPGLPTFARALLGFVVTFLVAVVPCVYVATYVVPPLLPLGGRLLDPSSAYGVGVAMALVAGLGGAVCAAARPR